MFKQATIYRLKAAKPFNDADFQARSFTPCGATQDKSVGWVPPRGNANDAMVENVAGQTIIKLFIETKTVPAQTVKDAVAVRVKHIETTQGRKPGKKETREIRDDVHAELLPHAFPKRVAVIGWINSATGHLVVDSTSQSRTDDFVTMLVRTIPGVQVSMVNTVRSPSHAMTQWLLADSPDEWPDNLNVGRDCVLESADETKAVVKYGRHPLDIDEVRTHVTQGKTPTQLALTWDGRVSFALTDTMKLKKLQFLDGVFEDQASDNTADAFDADVAIYTGEMTKLIEDLLHALGGEVVVQEGGAV